MFCVPLHSLPDSLLHSLGQCSPILSFHVPQTLKCLWLTFLSGAQTEPTANPRWLSEFHHLCYLIPAPQDMWPKGFGSLLADLASSGPIVDDSTVRGSPPRSDPSCELSRKLVVLVYKSVTVSHLIPTHTVLATPLSLVPPGTFAPRVHCMRLWFGLSHLRCLHCVLPTPLLKSHSPVAMQLTLELLFSPRFASQHHAPCGLFCVVCHLFSTFKDKAMKM